MGVAGVVALVVIFICFPLLVYASFRIVLSADRGEPEDQPGEPGTPGSPDDTGGREER